VDSNHIYWTNTNFETIGRADLDGQNVNQNFIVLTGQPVSTGLAADSNNIYWADISHNSIGPGRVGRAKRESKLYHWLRSLAGLAGWQWIVAISTGPTTGNSLGQADLDGQNVNQSFIPTAPAHSDRGGSRVS